MVHICYSRITEPQLVFTDDLLDGRSQLKTNKGGGAERWCQDMPARHSLIARPKPNLCSANQKSRFKHVSR